MEQRRCCINPLELQEKLCEERIDIEQKGSDSLIFGKNEREKEMNNWSHVHRQRENCEGSRSLKKKKKKTERFLSILTAAKWLREFLN